MAFYQQRHIMILKESKPSSCIFIRTVMSVMSGCGRECPYKLGLEPPLDPDSARLELLPWRLPLSLFTVNDVLFFTVVEFNTVVASFALVAWNVLFSPKQHSK